MKVQEIIHNLIVNETLLHVYSSVPHFHQINQVVSLVSVSYGVYNFYCSYLGNLANMLLQQDIADLSDAVRSLVISIKNQYVDVMLLQANEANAYNKVPYDVEDQIAHSKKFSIPMDDSVVENYNKVNKASADLKESETKLSELKHQENIQAKKLQELKIKFEAQKVNNNYFWYIGLAGVAFGVAWFLGDWSIFNQTREIRKKAPEIVEALSFKIKG